MGAITLISKGIFKLDVAVKVNGKQFRKRLTFKGTKSRAAAKYYAIAAELRANAGVANDWAQRTFSDLLKYYWMKTGRTGKQNDNLKKILLSELGDIPLKPSQGEAFGNFVSYLEIYYNTLRFEINPYSGENYTPSTVNRYIGVVKSCFNFLVKLGVIEKSPINPARFPKLKENVRDEVFLSVDDETRLLSAVQKKAPHLFPIISFALQVPARLSELVNLRRSEVDIINNLIRIPGDRMKNGRPNVKPIPPNLIEYFRNLPPRTEWAFYRYVKVSDSFSNLGNFTRAWESVKEAADLNWLRFHDLRHISATKLINRGTPERVVMQIAGWRTNMLATYYGKNDENINQLTKFSDSNREDVEQGDTRVTLERKRGNG